MKPCFLKLKGLIDIGPSFDRYNMYTDLLFSSLASTTASTLWWPTRRPSSTTSSPRTTSAWTSRRSTSWWSSAGCTHTFLQPQRASTSACIFFLQCTKVSCFYCESNVNGVTQFWIKMQMACECQWTYNISLLELFLQPNIVVKSFPWAAVDVVVCCCGWCMQGLLENTEKDRVRRLIGSSLPQSHDFPSWWIFPVYVSLC